MKSMVKRFATASVTAVVALSLSACVLSSDNEESGGSNYLPLALNNSWVFQSSLSTSTDTAKVEGTVTVDGNTYFTMSSLPALDFGTFRETADGLLTSSAGQEQEIAYAFIEDADVGEVSNLSMQLGESEWQFLEYPLSRGDTWDVGTVALSFTSVQENVSYDYSVDATLKGVAPAKASITVPAGTFEDAVRVDWTVVIKTTRTPTGGGSSFTLTITQDLGTGWFVDGVGLVKYEDDEETIELVSYNLN